jgi:peptidoglycan-associated lipoprotein
MTVRTASVIASCFAVAFFLGGCPRRPVIPAAQAPPPVVAAPPPAPAPPRVPSAPPKEYRGHRALREIRFDFDHSSVRAGDAKILDALADWLKRNGSQVVLIEGHCDDRGTSEYNMALGERRARAAADYLIGKGIAASRLLLISYGKERPLCEEKTEACRAANRRGAFLVKER